MSATVSCVLDENVIFRPLENAPDMNIIEIGIHEVQPDPRYDIVRQYYMNCNTYRVLSAMFRHIAKCIDLKQRILQSTSC